MNRLSQSAKVALAAAALAGCSADVVTAAASFAGPAGLTVAGAKLDRLFIANSDEDALQVAVLDDELTGLRFERAEAVHFPLRIPVGPKPRDLAASLDGRYVVVLNATGTLRLVDAAALSPVRVDGEVLVLEVGPAAAAASALVAAPEALTAAEPGDEGLPRCSGPCGRYFVALSGLGSVAVVDLETDAEGASPRLVLRRQLPVGGAPLALAISSDGQILFVADALGEQVLRVDVASGVTLDALPTGAVPGPLAVSRDGDLLLVARAERRDLVVFAGASTLSPALVDADAAVGPGIGCIAPCDAVGSACVGAHPADASVCATGSGLLSTTCEQEGDLCQGAAPAAYQAVYLGYVPTHILPLGLDAAGAGRALSIVCGTGSPETCPAPSVAADATSCKADFEQFAAVVGTDGYVRTVALRDLAGAPPTPQLASVGFCKAPSLSPVDDDAADGEAPPPLADYLAACPSTPARARYACVDAGDGAGAVVFPGITGDSTWLLDWQGALVEAAIGGAVVELEAGPQTHFRDGEVDFAARDVRAGDVLEITAAPLAGCALPRCRLEWRILGVGVDPTRGELALDAHTLVLDTGGADLPRECLPRSGAVAYRVRAGDEFLVWLGSRFVGRLTPASPSAPASTFGPGGTSGYLASLLFSTKLGLDRTLLADTCAFYDEGEAVLADPRFFSRDRRFGFSVQDPTDVLLAGRDLGSDVSPTPSAGLLPGGMLLTSLPGGAPVVFVSYGGTNTLLGYEPYDGSLYDDQSHYVIVR